MLFPILRAKRGRRSRGWERGLHAEPGSDDRGQFGYGRPAHGSDPDASYVFESEGHRREHDPNAPHSPDVPDWWDGPKN
jgi:hypothetical protein